MLFAARVPPPLKLAAFRAHADCWQAFNWPSLSSSFIWLAYCSWANAYNDNSGLFNDSMTRMLSGGRGAFLGLPLFTFARLAVKLSQGKWCLNSTLVWHECISSDRNTTHCFMCCTLALTMPSQPAGVSGEFSSCSTSYPLNTRTGSLLHPSPYCEYSCTRTLTNSSGDSLDSCAFGLNRK